MYQNRRWLIIPTSFTSSINFNEVLESSNETLRVSLDGSKTFIKYDINQITSSITTEYINAETGEITYNTIEPGVYGRPSFYTSSFEEYTHEEIINVLSGNEWTSIMPKE